MNKDDCDILCVQEHWLHDFECENFFETNFPGVKYHYKCAESDISFQRTVNKHGVAILWKQELNPYITKLQDGNDRIIGIKLQNKQNQYCIINVYGPTQGKSGASLEINNTLDILHEIIEKYENEGDIVVAGDLNMSLVRFKTADRFLQRFVIEHKLTVPGRIPRASTFTSRNAANCSQIDYVFSNNSVNVSNFKIHTFNPINTSTHTLIEARLTWKHTARRLRKPLKWKCPRIKLTRQMLTKLAKFSLGHSLRILMRCCVMEKLLRMRRLSIHH